MLVGTFIKGGLIGLSIAMPVGPIGLICIQHSLLRGMLYGLASGLGAACADMIYGFAVGFGISAVATTLLQFQFWLQLFGTVFLWYLGIKAFRSAPPKSEFEQTQIGLWRVFLTTFALTLTNPMTLLCFAGIFAGLGVCTEGDNMISVFTLAGGVLIGSAAWWLILSASIALVRTRLSPQLTLWLSRLSGGMILFFAAFATLTVLSHFF